LSEHDTVEAVGELALGVAEGVAAAVGDWLGRGAADRLAVGLAVAGLAGRAAGRLAGALCVDECAAVTAWSGGIRMLAEASVLAIPERVKASMTMGDDSAAVSLPWLGWLGPVSR
jgi:hypothetical protein